jgi:predicted ester cyclase
MITDASTSEHEAVIRRWVEAYNDRDQVGEAEVRAPDYVAHVPGEPEPLRGEAWTRFIGGFSDGLPDLRLTVEDVVAHDDLGAARVTFRGTHTGEFQGLPPTNKQVAFSGLELNRFVDGKVAEHWVQLDQLALLQQLGLIVVPGPRMLARILAHRAKKLRGLFTRS